jgi:hypothetical protein
MNLISLNRAKKRLNLSFS